jgi:hypothetical protein
VVDDLAATHRDRDRIEVENVSANRLRTQCRKPARGSVGPGQPLHPATCVQQPLDERAAEKPGAAGDKD